MLRTDLTDLINDGATWAFVGSGTSADAGYPTWRALVDSGLPDMSEIRAKITNDARFAKAYDSGNYETCFTIIEKHAGREHLEKAVASQVTPAVSAGPLIRIISDWPFAGYVTTNYDSLLESTLQSSGGGGWISVGNTDDEIRKVSGNARNLVWHVHGSVALDPHRSRLILTEKDYDDTYLEGSPLQRQLQAILTHKRLIFIGFGFNDPELRRLLKVVARYTSPTRPVLAFLADVPAAANDAGRLQLLEDFNLDVIPYRVENGSHSDLINLLRTHGALVLGRSLKFGQPQRQCPSYDEETTSLLIYNNLALSGNARVASDALSALVKARILALLRYRQVATLDELTTDLHERTKIVGQPSAISERTSVLASALKELEAAELIEHVDGGLGPAIQLTSKGQEFARDQSAVASRLEEQFHAAIDSRASTLMPSLAKEATARVTKSAETFLKESCAKRALGVALSWGTPGMDFQEFHIVALLQQLPDYAREVHDIAEAKCLIDVIKAVLSDPSDVESTYLGSLMQAHFGLHLMGMDPAALAARTREVANTLFLLDSTTLIPLLGRSSAGHAAAIHLLEQIAKVGASVATTELLSAEVAEHARWAVKELGESKSLATLQALTAATGRTGAGDNVFIDGAVAEAAAGKSLDFTQYLRSVLQHPQGDGATDDIVRAAVVRVGIPCFDFDGWEGFETKLWSEREALQVEIANRRRANKNFRHDRQVQAEAEALLVIRGLRSQSFKLASKAFGDAYFLSHTRVIDEVAKPTRPITMRPQAAQQWLSTLTACPPEELKFLVSGLLWELSQRGMTIVNYSRICAVFSPLIDASKKQLVSEVEHHRNLIAERYGEGAIKAFQDVSDIDAPFVAESYFAKKARELEGEVATEKAARARAERESQLTQTERDELRRLKAKGFAKSEKHKRRKRKLQNRPNKSRRKKRH